VKYSFCWSQVNCWWDILQYKTNKVVYTSHSLSSQFLLPRDQATFRGSQHVLVVTCMAPDLYTWGPGGSSSSLRPLGFVSWFSGVHVLFTMCILEDYCACPQWALCMIISLAQNSLPSLVCTKLFSSSGTLHVDFVSFLLLWDFVRGKIYKFPLWKQGLVVKLSSLT